MTQEELREVLSYDENTGLFVWKAPQVYNNVPVGSVAGWNNGKGAKRICVFNGYYLQHRLAWFYVHGYWPDQIDHINGDRGDNRLCNLREATNGQNQANMGPKTNNRLGIRGVSFRKGAYLVQLAKTTNGVRFNVCGRFKTLEAAVEFSISKRKELHGEFARASP